jgi:hypothetical protein
MIGANAACEIAQGPDRSLCQLREAQCARGVQLLHAKYDLSLIGIGACGCALFLVQRVPLCSAYVGILLSDTRFRESVHMLRNGFLGRRRQSRMRRPIDQISTHIASSWQTILGPRSFS